jgi:hypothetical protein
LGLKAAVHSRNIHGIFSDIQGTFGDIQGTFGDIQGTFKSPGDADDQKK